MQTALEEVLHKKKQRTIAEILGAKEQIADPHLDSRARQALRKVILDKVNDLYELVIDITDTLDTGEVVLNEDYLEKIAEIHDKVSELAEAG